MVNKFPTLLSLFISYFLKLSKRQNAEYCRIHRGFGSEGSFTSQFCDRQAL